MNINVNIVAPELVGALNNLAAAFGNNNPLAGVSQSEIVKPLETSVPKEEKPKTKKEKQPEPKEVPDADLPSNPKPEATPEPEPVEEEKNTSGITLDMITTKTREFIQRNASNRKGLKAFLDRKGAAKVSELPESEYEELLEFFEGDFE